MVLIQGMFQDHLKSALARLEPPAYSDPSVERVAAPLEGETRETMTGPCLAIAVGHFSTLQSDSQAEMEAEPVRINFQLGDSHTKISYKPLTKAQRPSSSLYPKLNMSRGDAMPVPDTRKCDPSGA